MKKYMLLIVMLVWNYALLADGANPGKPDLEQQFKSIREQSELVEQFRMLKAYQVEAFWKAVKDTLKLKDKTLAEIREQVSTFDARLNALQVTINQKDEIIKEMEHAGTHISVLGIDVSKNGFLVSVALIVIALLALATFAFFAFRMSFIKARESQKLYDDIYQEYESYKHRMVEKEVKILRELQDYRNRFVELKSA